MGCDIHVYVEYSKKEKNKKEETHWSSFGGRINPGRNYFLFGIMSKGVRCEPKFSFKAKGIPEDAGFYSSSENTLYISESEGEGSCTLEDAKRYAKHGSKIINNSEGEPTWVEHPDWHSHSWLSTKEFQKAMDFYNKEADSKWVEPEYEAVLAIMKRFEELGYNSRIVFWFDN